MEILKNSLSTNIILVISILVLLSISISSANAVNVTLNAGDAGGVNSAVSTVASVSDVNNTITLNPGTYNKTTDRNSNISFNNKNLIIQGNGSADSVKIDAQKLGRLFSITGNSNITFLNITFINGTISGNGGAIYKTGTGTFTLINCSFMNNNASSDGGAVYNTGPNFSIFSSNFTNNIARGTFGGAVYNGAANFLVDNCSFINNTVTGTYSCGGAIVTGNTSGSSYVNNFIVNNSTFINNTASISSGGGIYCEVSDVIIDNCTFINNSANYGGACSINGAEFGKVLNSVFLNNSAIGSGDGEGGAIEDNDNYYLLIFNTTFSINKATKYGGAISNYLSDYTTINNCSFINNTCPNGGDIYNFGHAYYTSIINSTFINNTNASVFIRGLNITVTGCNFTNNTLAINITGTNAKIFSCNVINNTQGIFLTGSALNTNINYNRIFKNTHYDLNNTGVNTNADFNWWGNNTPTKIIGIIPNNYFVMNVNNITSLDSNGTVTFNYTFSLNDTEQSFNISLLPYFVTNVFTNVTTSVIDSFDARFDRTFNVTVTTSGNILYTFINDNEIQTLKGTTTTISEPTLTNIEVNNPKGKNGETVDLIAKLTDKNGNLLDGKLITFHVVGMTLTAITDADGIATVQYIINEDDFTDGKLAFTATFEGDDNYIASTTTGTVTLIEKPIPPEPTPTPTPTPTPEPDNNQTNNNPVVNAAMKETGIPIIAILIVLLSSLGLVIRKK